MQLMQLMEQMKLMELMELLQLMELMELMEIMQLMELIRGNLLNTVFLSQQDKSALERLIPYYRHCQFLRFCNSLMSLDVLEVP